MKLMLYAGSAHEKHLGFLSMTTEQTPCAGEDCERRSRNMQRSFSEQMMSKTGFKTLLVGWAGRAVTLKILEKGLKGQ